MVADGLGLELDNVKEVIQPVIAKDVVKTEFLEVEPGQVAGVHQIARGSGRGRESIYMELKMYVGAPESSDTVELTGHPNIRLTVPGGTHGDIATAAVVVNCIPAILDAPAGLRTSRDLPMCFFPSTAKP
jgi:4-hydroxy-tetrahydrodipicolinate reductase